jgi:GntR family transcriptional regulator, transcriptional repressor for pyruvate dehydrogenase complex
MKINPINDRMKSELIAESIIDQIKSNAWPAGKKIPGEHELSEKFNVSRTSVRQAISQLVGEGILVVRRGKGTFVNEVKLDDFFGNLRKLFIMETPEYLEIQEFRKIIEPSIAFLAAEKATEEEIAALGASVKNQLECLRSGDSKGYAEEDQHFHQLLAECVKNNLVNKTMSILGELMEQAMEYTTAITGFKDGVEFHKKLYERIKRKECEKAASVMKQHIENNIAAVRNAKKK